MDYTHSEQAEISIWMDYTQSKYSLQTH